MLTRLQNLRVACLSGLVLAFLGAGALPGAAEDGTDGAAASGWSALWSNNFAVAEQQFRAALRIDRHDDSAHRGLVLALLARGKDDPLHEALDDYAREVPAGPSDYFLPDLIYWFCDIGSRDYHESLHDFAERLASSCAEPVDARMCWSQAARFALMAGDRGAAEKAVAQLHRIDAWYLLGPFDNTSGCGHRRDHAYGGRPTQAPYRGKFGQTISWFTPELVGLDGRISPTGYFHHNLYTTAYARAAVRIPAARTYLVSVSYAGDMEFSVNDVPVGMGSRHTGGDEALHWLIDLPEGVCLLSFKVSNREKASTISCAISERDGAEVKGLEFDAAGPIQHSTPETLHPRPVRASFLRQVEARAGGNPDDAEARLWDLYRARLVAEPDSLVALCDDLTDRFPESGLMQLVVAEAYGAAGEDDLREQLIERAAELSPDLAPAVLFLARRDMSRKRFEMARSQAQSVLQRAPSCRAALDIKLECLLKEQRLEELREEAESVTDFLRDEPLGYTYLAEHASERGLVRDEKRYSREAIKRMPVYSGRAAQYIRNVEEEEYNEAARDLRRFLDVSPDSEFLWVSYVQILLAQDKVDDAWETVLSALRSFPQSIPLIYCRALFYESCYDFSITSIWEHFPDGQRVLTDEELEAMYPSGNYPTRVIRPEESEATRKWVEYRCNAQAADMLEKALEIAPGDFEIRDKIRALRGKKPYRTFMKDPDLDEILKLRVDASEYAGRDAVVLREWKRRLAYDRHASVLDYVLAVQVLNEEGVRRWEDYGVGIDPHANDIVFLEHMTVKQDGSEHDAEVVGSTVVFSGLEPGDVLFLHYQMTASVAGALSGRFWDHHQFSFGGPCLESTYVLIVPEGLEVETQLHHAEAFGDALEHVSKSLEDGYRLESWTLREPPPVGDELGSPPPTLYLPWIDVSSIPKWSEVAGWYEDLALGQAEVTAPVSAKARELASGAENEDAIVRRVLRFVSDEITYRFVPFYQSAHVPREAEQVLKDKAGDCKDKCTLMLALLEAAGVEGCRPALVSPGSDASVSFLPSPRFSHVVLHHRRSDGTELWYDPTVRFAAPGQLPISLSGAPALVAAEDETGLRVMPRTDVTSAPREVTTRVELHDDGSADVNRTIVYRSIDDTAPRRAHIESASREELEKEVLASLASEYPGCELVSFDVLGTDDPDTALVYMETFHVPRLFSSTADILSGQLPSGSRLNNAFGAIVAGKERATPIDLRPLANCSKLETVLELPEGKDLMAVPADCAYQSGGSSYEASYSVASGKLTARHRIVIDGMVVRPNDYEEFKTFLEASLQDLQSPVLLQ
jgi:tetratricopeptide (TPR) repeat protein